MLLKCVLFAISVRVVLCAKAHLGSLLLFLWWSKRLFEQVISSSSLWRWDIMWKWNYYLPRHTCIQKIPNLQKNRYLPDLPLKYGEGCIGSFGSLLLLCSTPEDRRWSPHTLLLPVLDLGPALHVFHNLKTLNIKIKYQIWKMWHAVTVSLEYKRNIFVSNFTVNTFLNSLLPSPEYYNLKPPINITLNINFGSTKL